MTTLRLGATLLAGLLVAVSLSAQSGNFQRVQGYETGIGADLETVCMDAGTARLSPVDPVTDAQIRRELDRIDPERLSPLGKAAYERLVGRTRSVPRIAGGGAGLSITPRENLEVYLRSDEDIPWIYGYERRPPFLEVPVETWYGDFAYALITPAIKMDLNAVNARAAALSSTNAISLPLDTNNWDLTEPYRALGSFGGEGWNFRIGRDRISVGGAGDKNLTVSSFAECYDFARLSLFADDVAYAAYVVQLDVDRYFYFHRADIRLADNLSFGLLEGTLVGKAPLELRFLNPFMLFHSYFAWQQYLASTGTNMSGVGSELGLELTWVPARHTELFFQGVVNGYNGWPKSLIWPDAMTTLPNSIGALAGGRLRVPEGPGFLEADLLAAYTTPYLYLLQNKYIWFRYDRYDPNNVAIPGKRIRSTKWLGFEDGPDCILAQASAGYRVPGSWYAGLDASWRIHGAKSVTQDANLVEGSAAAQETTPTGVAETRLVLGARAELEILSWLAAKAQVHHTSRWNADNVAGAVDDSWELVLSLAIH